MAGGAVSGGAGKKGGLERGADRRCRKAGRGGGGGGGGPVGVEGVERGAAGRQQGEGEEWKVEGGGGGVGGGGWGGGRDGGGGRVAAGRVRVDWTGWARMVVGVCRIGVGWGGRLQGAGGRAWGECTEGCGGGGRGTGEESAWVKMWDDIGWGGRVEFVERRASMFGNRAIGGRWGRGWVKERLDRVGGREMRVCGGRGEKAEGERLYEEAVGGPGGAGGGGDVGRGAGVGGTGNAGSRERRGGGEGRAHKEGGGEGGAGSGGVWRVCESGQGLGSWERRCHGCRGSVLRKGRGDGSRKGVGGGGREGGWDEYERRGEVGREPWWNEGWGGVWEDWGVLRMEEAGEKAVAEGGTPGGGGGVWRELSELRWAVGVMWYGWGEREEGGMSGAGEVE
ncbi:hypothetical protein Tco_0814598, partial [Tanacetum coccineum]